MAEYNPSKIIKDGNTYNFRDNTKIPLAGSNQISGDLIPATDNSVNLGDSTYGFATFYVNKIYLKGSTIFNVVDNNYICVGGAAAQVNGANLVLNGKDRSTSTGEFKLEARDGTNVKQLIGKPDGTLSWNGNIIPSADDIYSLGSSSYNFQYVNARRIRQNNVSDSLFLVGALTWDKGASISLFGKDNTTLGGGFRLDAHNGTDFRRLQGSPDGTLTWDGQPIQTSSDQRLKQQIAQIDDDLLTAWEDVEPVQFKYNDAVEQKSDNARLHTGYVVQQIDEACKSHNVDVSKYGLYCHEEYAEETREVEHEDGTKTVEVVRPVNEHYSLRYTEALIVECAYLRKCIKELRAEIEDLKSSK